MPLARIPSNEVERIAALRSYAVLDKNSDEVMDGLTRLAARIAQCPIALVSLVDTDRQWFLARHGMAVRQTPRDVAFCAHAILEPHQVLEVPDALCDPRFVDNPLTQGPAPVRSYAGAPLVSNEGLALGTLCVIDHMPRQHDAETLDGLRTLARAIMVSLEMRRTLEQLRMMSMFDPGMLEANMSLA
jgi:diguanylate cyclase